MELMKVTGLRNLPVFHSHKEFGVPDFLKKIFGSPGD
jgi:hypothetical protein